MKSLSLMCLLFVLGGVNAYAQTQADSSATHEATQWKLHEYTYSLSGFPVPKDIRRKPFSAETIYTNSSDKGDVAITCLREKLYLSVETKPINFEEFVVNHLTSQRAKVRAVTLRIDGDKKSRNRWTYIPEHKVLLAQKRSDKVKVYNAAISGKAVTLEIGNGKAFKLNLLKPNSTFANFGANCGLGRNKA
ncbi:MAG: hypothetical protein ABJN69_16595 [Hellea sp.]